MTVEPTNYIYTYQSTTDQLAREHNTNKKMNCNDNTPQFKI